MKKKCSCGIKWAEPMADWERDLHKQCGNAAERLRTRLGLFSSNVAQPHKNLFRTFKRPGKNNRRAQQQQAIKDQQ